MTLLETVIDNTQTQEIQRKPVLPPPPPPKRIINQDVYFKDGGFVDKKRDIQPQLITIQTNNSMYCMACLLGGIAIGLLYLLTKG